jgi:hypothetical protein
LHQNNILVVLHLASKLIGIAFKDEDFTADIALDNASFYDGQTAWLTGKLLAALC